MSNKTKIPKAKYSLRWREGKKMVRSVSTFRTIASAREHASFIGARNYVIRRLTPRKGRKKK